MVGRRANTPTEVFWLHDRSPQNLRRRADDIESDGLLAMAQAFRERADELEAAIREGKGATPQP